MGSAAVATSPLAPGLKLTVDPAWLLARRATHAATSAQVADIRKAGTKHWLETQLAPATIDDRATDAFVAKTFPVTVLDMPGIRRVTGGKPWEAQPSLARATAWRQLTTTRPLWEKVVEMWHDHLHIALGDDEVAGWLCTYDREVIRAHAMGRFADLLYAATTHPAMLRYLDNTWSTKAQPAENLARELLELHTVGTGAHTERDVKALAKLLTGFSVDTESGRFVYRPEHHATGAVTIVGTRLANATPGAGPAELRTLIEKLAVHPATVRRLVTRMAQRFVSDTPPASLISRLSSVYLANRTAVTPVLRTLFTSREFAESTGRKWARPQEYLAAAYAAGRPRYVAPKTGGVYAPLGTYLWLLETLGHVPMDHPDPDGPKDIAAAWLNPGALLARWNAAEAVAGHWGDTLSLQPWVKVLGLTASMTYGQAATRLFTQLTGYAPMPADRDALAGFLANPNGTGAPPASARLSSDALTWHVGQAVRLVLASPYMSLR